MMWFCGKVQEVDRAGRVQRPTASGQADATRDDILCFCFLKEGTLFLFFISVLIVKYRFFFVFSLIVAITRFKINLLQKITQIFIQCSCVSLNASGAKLTRCQ